MRRLLLVDDASRDAIAGVFGQLGWQPVDASISAPATVAYKRSWSDAASGAAASHIENLPFDVSFVFASDGAHGLLQSALGDAGLLLGIEAVLASDLGSEAAARRGIGRLGLLAHGPLNLAVLSRLVALLVQPDPRWQRIALFSLSYAGWPEFDEVLTGALAEGAFAGDLSDAAGRLLSDLRATGWNRALYSETSARDEES